MSKQKKYIVLPTVLLAVAMLFAVPVVQEQAFAQTSKPTVNVKAADHLKKDPFAMKILEQMELQKLQYAKKQTQETAKDAQDAYIEQQRLVAQKRLAERITSLAEEYQDYTPKASFARFVDKKPEITQPVYWGMFDYMQGKVDAARAAMKDVIDNGGSLQEARDAYFKHAATKRTQLIQVVKDLNVQHGLAEKSVQDTFDVYGKLPRYDD